MATIPPYPPTVRKIKDGEPVQASTANKPPEDLTQRTDHLKARVDQSQLGQTLTLISQKLDVSVEEGNIVFRDPVDKKFKPALTAVRQLPNTTTGVIDIDDSSFSWGVVISKTEAELGDIQLMGILPAGFDFSNTISDAINPTTGSFNPGAYYLSSTVAGKATQNPAISALYQFFLSDDGSAFLLPSPHGILEDHIHRVVLLTAEPAGLSNCVEDVDDVHEITISNSALPGWLPADDPIFGSAAPVGAKFGYNVAADQELSNIFPPTPLEGTFLQKNGITVSGQDVIIDNSGIWWLQNDFGNVPWPVDIDPCGGSLGSSSVPGSGETEVELRLFMTEFITKTDQTVVTQLTLADGEQSIQLLNPDGGVNTSGTGRIKIALSLNLVSGDDDLIGSLVVKEVSGNVVSRGPVVEKIQPGPSGLITVDSSLPDGQGIVTLDIPALPSSTEATTNLRIVPTTPATAVQMLSGALWDNTQGGYINVPSAQISPVFNPVAVATNVRFDLVVFDVSDFLGVQPQFLTIIQGAEVPAATGDPFVDAPSLPSGDLVLAIVKIDADSGLGTVNIQESDIINLETFNRVFSLPSIGLLRRDGLDASGGPDAAGSVNPTGGDTPYAPAGHSHPVNVDSVLPLSPVGSGDPGTSLIYARRDHRHPAPAGLVLPPIGLHIDLGRDLSSPNPAEAVITAGLVVSLQDTPIGTVPTKSMIAHVPTSFAINMPADLDTGSEVADSWYHIYLAGDTGVGQASVIGVFSLNITGPDAGFLTSNSLDVFRRIGSIKNSSSSFLEGINYGGRTTYVDNKVVPGITLTTVNAGAGSFVVFPVEDSGPADATFLPPTSRRGICAVTLNAVSLAIQELFQGSPDYVSGSTGGVIAGSAAQFSGIGHSDLTTTKGDFDVDASQDVALRRGTTALQALTFHVVGYYETL